MLHLSTLICIFRNKTKKEENVEKKETFFDDENERLQRKKITTGKVRERRDECRYINI